MSSKPVTATSAGTATLASRSALSAPIAMASLAANTAVGRRARRSSATPASNPEVSVKSPGTSQTSSRPNPAACAAARNPRSRSAASELVSGPRIIARRRCPRPTRCCTMSAEPRALAIVIASNAAPVAALFSSTTGKLAGRSRTARCAPRAGDITTRPSTRPRIDCSAAVMAPFSLWELASSRWKPWRCAVWSMPRISSE